MKLVNFRFGRDCESVEAVDTDRIISMSKEKGSTKLRIMLCGTKEDHIFDYFFSTEECRDEAFSRLLIMSSNRG